MKAMPIKLWTSRLISTSAASHQLACPSFYSSANLRALFCSWLVEPLSQFLCKQEDVGNSTGISDGSSSLQIFFTSCVGLWWWGGSGVSNIPSVQNCTNCSQWFSDLLSISGGPALSSQKTKTNQCLVGGLSDVFIRQQEMGCYGVLFWTIPSNPPASALPVLPPPTLLQFFCSYCFCFLYPRWLFKLRWYLCFIPVYSC